jgi:membrane-bound serine protease (ClpP class)
VILLDTPGGLSTSMKTIYTAELNAKLPVIVYVSPDGARAASAGVWIAQAADVLAMAPTTNIGSSTPIDSSGQNLGSDLRRKVINDAAASLTALAAAHKRNTTWPALAVRKASNLTAQQALHMHVIDAIAPTLPALLTKLDGYRTKDRQRPYTLHLAGAHIDTVSPGFVTRFLNTVIDPNLISILFLAGIVGLIFEVLHPGVVLPGALGAVSLVLALYGFSVLNPNWGGVALVVLGVALLVIDLHAVTHGALTAGGLIALGFGLALLFQNQPPGYHVNLWLIVGVGLAIAAFWSFTLGKGVAARRQPVKFGPELLVGMDGEVRDSGLVFVNGELWQADAADAAPLVPGEQVTVEAVEGIRLRVRPSRSPATVP